MCDLSAHREAVGVSCAVVTKALQRGCNDGAQVPKAMQKGRKGHAKALQQKPKTRDKGHANGVQSLRTTKKPCTSGKGHAKGM